MSFMDKRWEFWDNATLTVTEESRTNGEMKDMEEGGASDDMLDRLVINFKVGTAFTGMANGCTLEVLTSDSATFASGVKCIGAIGSEDYPLLIADLVAGKELSLIIPNAVLHRYLEVRIHMVNAQATAGTLGAWAGMEAVSPLKIQKEPT